MVMLLRIISIVVTVGSAAALIWRALENSGVPIKRRLGAGTAVLEKPHVPGTKECLKIFLYVLLFRIFVIVAGFIVYSLFVDEGSTPTWEYITKAWVKWDAPHYKNIADSYTAYVENGDYTTLVFFPLYPVLMKIAHIFIPDMDIAALTVSSLCYAGACVYMYKLVCIDYKRETAQKSVILMTLFPFGFFYGGIMTESTFLLTVIGTLYYTRRHNWIMTGIMGMLAALSRSAGVFVIIPATVEFIEEYNIFGNIKNIKAVLGLVLKKWLWLLLMPLGTCIYLYINYSVAGDPFEFLRLEEEYWYQVGQPFFITVGSLWDIINGGYSISTKMGAFIPGLVILLCMYGVMIAGLRKHRTMYMVWFLVYLTVNTTMSWPLSLCRYLACTVPAYVVLGDMCSRNKKLYTALMMSFGILFGIYFCGYITGKQIM